MDIGSPQTIRACHIFGFSKNPKLLENLEFWEKLATVKANKHCFAYLTYLVTAGFSVQEF